MFTFQAPASAEPGRIYRVSVNLEDPECPLDPSSTAQYWLAGAGKNVRIPLVSPGQSRLEVSNNGDKAPIPLAVVKGAFIELGRAAEYSTTLLAPPDQFDGWETEIDFYGSVKDRKQRFRWSTELTSASSAVLQVGMMPFSTGYEADPFSPPGLLASWPVDCVNCEFVVDLSPLPAPEPKKSPATSAQASDSVLDKMGQLISAAFNTIGDFFGNVAMSLAGLFGGSKEPETVPSLKTLEIEVSSSKVTIASPNLALNSATGPVNPLVFTTFYFRVLPMKDSDPAGGGSNTVILDWEGDSTPDINISIVTTPTPKPTPAAYEVEIACLPRRHPSNREMRLRRLRQRLRNTAGRMVGQVELWALLHDQPDRGQRPHSQEGGGYLRTGSR